MKKSVIIQPVISEKSYEMANTHNKYTFYVDSSSTKIEIAKAVESQYKVAVQSVNTVVKPGKSRTDWRRNRTTRNQDRKKAIVQLKSGSKIDDFFNV